MGVEIGLVSGVLFGHGDRRGDRSGKRSAVWAISKWLEWGSHTGCKVRPMRQVAL